MRNLPVFFLFLVSLNVYGQPAYILHKPYSREAFFIDSTITPLREAEAIVKINELTRWAKDNKDEAFTDELKLAEYRFAMEHKKDSVMEKKLTDMAIYAKEKGDHYLEANALYVTGEYFGMGKKRAKSLEYYIASYNIYSRLTPQEFPRKKEYLYMLGVLYLQNGDNNNAIKLLLEANNTIGMNNDYVNPINNAIGLYYRNTLQYDSAVWYFKNIYDSAISSNDTQWVGISAGNIGGCYYRQGRYDSAIPLFKKDIEYSYQTSQIKNAIRTMYYLADIYYIRHGYTESEEILKKALSAGESKQFWPQYQLAEPIYELLSKIYAAQNDSHRAYIYLDSAMTAKDSVNERFSALNLVQAHENIESVQRKLEAQKLSADKRVQMLIRNSLVLAIILVLVIGILLINRQRLKQKKLAAEKNYAEAELVTAAKLLDNFRQSVQEKNSIIEQVTNELTQAKEGALQQIDNESLIKLERSIILTDEQWEDFRVLFEKVHKGFFKRIKEKMPDLTPAEMRFVALSKLKLSPKEMAAMLGISSNSIRNYRHRLRRKLGLDEEASIEEIADAI